MKTSNILLVLAVLTALAGCAKSTPVPAPRSTGPAAPSPVRFTVTDANQPFGSYRSKGCFLDRAKTVSRRSYVYANATYHFLADGTASSEYTYFADDQCSQPVTGTLVEKTDFVSYTVTETTEKVRILVLTKPKGTVRDPRLYIPMAKSASGYILSLDYLQTSSAGPFVTLPEADELRDFELDAAKYGIEFTRL